MLYFNKTTYEVDADASFNYLKLIAVSRAGVAVFSQLS